MSTSRKQRFITLSVPTSEPDICFWFVYDTLNRGPSEVRSYEEAKELAASANKVQPRDKYPLVSAAMRVQARITAKNPYGFKLP